MLRCHLLFMLNTNRFCYCSVSLSPSVVSAMVSIHKNWSKCVSTRNLLKKYAAFYVQLDWVPSKSLRIGVAQCHAIEIHFNISMSAKGCRICMCVSVCSYIKYVFMKIVSDIHWIHMHILLLSSTWLSIKLIA